MEFKVRILVLSKPEDPEVAEIEIQDFIDEECEELNSGGEVKNVSLTPHSFLDTLTGTVVASYAVTFTYEQHGILR